MGNSSETQESGPSSYGEMAATATATALAKASSKDFMVVRREWAAVRIQTIFRSFLVKIHRLLLQSRYRTRKKEEADLLFVPTYVKCVRMMGGLSDKEINQTYVKVLGQMPYFRLSGGRNHIFVFPSLPAACWLGCSLVMPRPTFKTIDEDSVIKLASKSVPLDCIASHTPEITLGKIDISLRW